MSGRHFGLKTYALYCEIKKSGSTRLKEFQECVAPYYEAIGDSEIPGICFDLSNGMQLQVEYEKSKFSSTVFDLKTNEESPDVSLFNSPGFMALEELMDKVNAIGIKLEIET